MQQETQRKIILLNASALKHLACPLNFYRTVLQGYSRSCNNVDIVYGSAFHAFVAEMNANGGQYPSAIKKARDLFLGTPFIPKKKKEWMNEQHLMKTCMDYWEHYNGKAKDEWQTVKTPEEVSCRHCVCPKTNEPRGKWIDEASKKEITCDRCLGKKSLIDSMIELKFCTLPYYVDDEPFTFEGKTYAGIEILLAGTIDDICKRVNGCYAIRDYKTTSSWDATQYLSDYRLSPQLIFYIFALYWYAKQYPQSIYGRITAEGRVAAFIDGIFLKSMASSAPSYQTQYQRSEMFFFSDKQLTEFQKMLDTMVIPRIVGMLRNGPPMPEGKMTGACTIVYGHCDFFNGCAAPDQTAEENILRNEFVQKEWNPLNYE